MARARVKIEPTPLQAYILLDRSGSMRGNWVETIGAMNAYVTELASDATSKTSKVTLSVFDAPQQKIDFTILRRSIVAADWVLVSPDEAAPRGYTPLYDAIGQIVSLAEADKPERAVFVIITDGAENCSRELKKDTAKAALDRCRERGWQVVFIGADFDAMAQSRDVGGVVGQTLSMNAGNYALATQSLAKKTRSYSQLVGSGAELHAAASATMSFNADDRAEAAGKKVKETGV